jgi:hypothetical protein
VYDMYPEWGSAPHEADHPARANRSSAPTLPARVTQPVQEALDRRDNGAPRDDDGRAGVGGRP